MLGEGGNDGLLGAATIAAVPSAASASATCTYDQAKREMIVRYGSADTSLTITNGGTILYSEGGGFLRSCFSTSGVAATPFNTSRVTVKAASSTTAPLKQTTTIDERNGSFTESSPNLQFLVLTGTGGDRLILREGPGADPMHLMDNPAIGPMIDLGYDGDVDLRMTTSNDAVVQVNGGNGADFIDATGVRTYHTVMLGEGGNDGLLGGTLSDSFDGGPGEDTIRAKDGIAEVVNGGADVDTGTFDYNVDQLSGIEHPGF
jgi:hypothetical protein